MSLLNYIAVSVGLLSLLAAQSAPQVLRPVWERTGPPWTGMVRAVALSAEGRCAAIATSSAVTVIDKDGREFWRWNFSDGNRFIVATHLALAPKCDWLAFTGSPDYRYVWLVHRNGKRTPFLTQGTPLTIEINHDGNLAAIGTGSEIVYLYASDGTLRWKQDLGSSAPLPISELSFAGDDSAIFISSWGQAVISIDGKTRWSGGVGGVGSAKATPTFTAFVAWGEPPHGPGIGTVAMLDGAGKILWQRYASDPRAIISSSGDLVVANMNANQAPSEEDRFRTEQLSSALRLISSSGDVVRTFADKGAPVAFAGDGRRFIIYTDTDFLALDLQGNPLWSIPASRYGSALLTTSDLHSVFVSTDAGVAWYSTP